MKTWVDIFTFWLKIKFVQIIFYPIFSPLKYTFSCSENGLQSKSFLNGSKDWNQIWTFDHYSNNLLQGVPKRIGLLSSFEFIGLWGGFLGVKNNSKNFRNKKNSWFFAKFWVNGHYLSEKCRTFCDFISLWPCSEWNIFSNGIKFIIYAYAHKIIECYDLKMAFERTWVEIQESYLSYF